MKTFHVLVATDLTDESMAVLHAADDLQVTLVPPKTKHVRDAIKTADALIARDDVLIDAELLETAPNLKVIGRVSAGLSGIDIDAASVRGIVVTNTPGTSAVAAGEHTLTLMLALSRRLVVTHNSLKEGWWLLDRTRQRGTQLYGKTLGIVGLGRVGWIVAQRCLAFGMNVIAYDPYLPEDRVENERIQLVGLRDLLQRSDFVSIHVPSTRETRGMFSEAVIRQMKPGARLINTAFGGVIDEYAAAAALTDGHLGGIGIDVYSEEPPYSSPLVGMDNVIHTPHIAENTLEATQDLSLQIVQQVTEALRGTNYRNVVNLPLIPGVEFETIRPYLTLAERMGALLHVLARYPVRRVAVEYRGEEVSGMVKPLTVALLKGLLAPALGDTVSYVNAPVLAAERGIQITQAKGIKAADYTTLVSCQVTLEDGEEIVISGTLLDRKEPHVVQINEYRMNFVPHGHLVVMGSYDQPGVIGLIGTLMANNQVNIASWHTGRAEPGGQTMTILELDHPAPEAVIAQLEALEFVRHVHQVAL